MYEMKILGPEVLQCIFSHLHGFPRGFLDLPEEFLSIVREIPLGSVGTVAGSKISKKN